MYWLVLKYLLQFVYVDINDFNVFQCHLYESWTTAKPTKLPVHPAKTQISLGTGTQSVIAICYGRNHFSYGMTIKEDMVNQLTSTHLPNSVRQLQHARDSEVRRTEFIYQILDVLYGIGKVTEIFPCTEKYLKT